jgi:hypothetical protein
VADGFTTDAVLLRGEVERNVVGLQDAVEGSSGGVVVSVPDGKGDVLETEGVRLGVGPALAVLPGAEKEEESHEGQIGDGALVGGSGVELGNDLVHVDEELEGDGSHLGWRWVLFVVRVELPIEAEVGFAEGVVAGIRGPHAGEDLGHGAKVLLHGPLVYRPTVGGKVACADLVGEHLEERDGIVDAVKGGIETEVVAEGAPLPPVGTIGGCAARMDASGNLVLAKAVDSPCRCCDVR